MIPHLSERALILAPLGRDSRIAASILTEAGFRFQICDSLEALVSELKKGAGFAVVTEETLKSADLTGLAAWIKSQPEWSDFPFILLTQRGGGIERNPGARRHLELLGNVTFLERPFHPTTLHSLAASAVRGRRKQYDARSRLEELHLGAEKYRSLFESIDAGFCIIEMIFDENGNPFDYLFIEANPAFERQTGLLDAVGRSMLSLQPAHEKYWFEIYGEVASTGKSVRFENHAAALGDIWYDVHAFRTGDPALGRVAILFNDISTRRRMEDSLRQSEEDLRNLNESLEERVIERSRELQDAQDALRQAQKLESLGQLTGGIAHDFNNLLMAVLSSLALLKKRIPNDPALHRLIANAQQGAERGAALTQRMLAFARRQDLTSESINVSKLVEGMKDLAQRTLGAEWEFDFDLSENLPRIVADPNQLEMALLNLLVNARDATPKGGDIFVRARAERAGPNLPDELESGQYIALSVIDRGQGMDADTLRRATEPFFTTKGVGKGTGLGLSMIHGLAKQLGGAFELQSAPGAGTTATLWLPANTVAQQATPATVEIPAVPASARRLKILAVDDDMLILMNTAALLEDLGHEVFEASSGDEALDLLKANGNLDLLITDQAMPKMTGAQLAQKVSEIKPDLPIVLATGYADLPDGFSQTIVKLGKPFGQLHLEEAIAKAMSIYSA